MNYSDVKRNLWTNTISNYVRTVVVLVTSLFAFRLLYRAFSKEEFGFWSLLWSVFGYGILLDFGFGIAAQKRAAELSAAKDWRRLSQVISTIFCVYCVVALFIITVVTVWATPLVAMLGVPKDCVQSFRSVFVVFFLGVGLAFPMGVFPEILRGLQRINLANNIQTASFFVRLGLTYLAIKLHWGFLAIVAMTMLTTVLPSFASALLVFRLLPEVRIRPSLFSRDLLKETLHFSVVAYVIIATNLVLGKTDQIVLAMFLNVGAVALYQVGYKIADIFCQFTRQLMDSLSPAAAYLHAAGHKEALRDLLIQSMRWSLLLATPLYLLCAFYFDGLLRVLTGDPKSSMETILVGQLLLLWNYALIFTHGNTRRIFIMCGHERKLLKLSLWEAGPKLVLSIGLVWYCHSLAMVAIGSLIPSLVIGWLILWPWAAREAGISGWALFRATVLPAWIAAAPMLAVLIVLRWLQPVPLNPIVKPFVEGGLAGVIGLLGVWHLALRPSERGHLWLKFANWIPILKNA